MIIPREEQETVISFTADDKMAQVYTCDAVYIRKLDRLCEKAPEQYNVIQQDDYSKTYTMPKRLVSFRIPREMTEEQRVAAVERLAKARMSIADE